MNSRVNCCDKYYQCCNHDSWHCDECIESHNLISHFSSKFSSNCINEYCIHNSDYICTFKLSVVDEGRNCEDIRIAF